VASYQASRHAALAGEPLWQPDAAATVEEAGLTPKLQAELDALHAETVRRAMSGLTRQVEERRGVSCVA